MATNAPWLIVGAGALGQLFAASLAQRQRVVLLGRRPTRHVIRLRKPDGTDHQIPARRESLEQWSGPESPALVILATKSHHGKTALDALASRLPPQTPLLLLQNGFLLQPRLTEQWSGPVLCASTTEAAYRPATASGMDLDPDSPTPDVIHAAAGETWIGDLADRHVTLATRVAECLADAGMKAAACQDIRHRLWRKLAINAVINPLTAIHRVRNGELASRAFRPRVAALIAEIAHIMQAEDVPPPAQGWDVFIGDVIQATANNRSSMLQDVLANRPTERDAILGPLEEAARHHGLHLPAIADLYRQTPP
ncbi:ketopantoate reductase family protein [Salinicola corii]|uniref:2-dehydropantoate 2-reductase n=2 Tax=Salinicola corii TaxID=2606937 RepID=A0A640WGM0_9GAMM|nr:ketopantoate reductase family protein [Salinicola corii]